MATAVVTVNVVSSWMDSTKYQVIGTFSIQANPATYVTGGLPVSFTGVEQVKASRTPLFINVMGLAVTAAQALYSYTYIPGVTAASGLLKIFAGTAELTNGSAIPAAVSGDTVNFQATWAGME